MPITASAKKAHKQSLRKKAANSSRKNNYRGVLKELTKLASEGNKKEAEKLLSKAYKALDKAAKTKVIEKNKASRLKSKVQRLVAK